MPKLQGGGNTGASDYHFTAGKYWRNYVDEQGASIKPENWREPQSRDELRSILEGLQGTTRVRAVGSGHADSDVARPDDVLVDMKLMTAALSMHSFHDAPAGLRDGQRLFRVEAGITIRELNDKLDREGLALANMGSYDGQKFIGAACTGTHGSGLKWGPLADSIASIELLTVEKNSAGRRVVALKRIEPRSGITDPGRFGQNASEQGMQLVVDDDLFHACVVSMGCLGIVYAVTLIVVPAYWLQEVRQQGAWSKLKHKLPGMVDDGSHYDLWILPHEYHDSNDHACMVLKRTQCPAGSGKPERPAEKGADFVAWIAKTLGTKAIGKALSSHPELFTGYMVDYFSKHDGDTFKSVSHNVYVLAIGADIQAKSSEIHVPLERSVEAVDAVLKLAKRNEAKGLFHTSPLGVRFIDASEHWLSMSYARRTCSIEIPLILGTKGAETILNQIEKALVPLGGRPHWGQHNQMTSRKARDMYPRFGDWLGFYRRFNRYGTFENTFTKRMGFPSEVRRSA